MADRLAAQLRWQASACASLGSGFYAVLLEWLADDAETGGPTARVLAVCVALAGLAAATFAGPFAMGSPLWALT